MFVRGIFDESAGLPHRSMLISRSVRADGAPLLLQDQRRFQEPFLKLLRGALLRGAQAWPWGKRQLLILNTIRNSLIRTALTTGRHRPAIASNPIV